MAKGRIASEEVIDPKVFKDIQKAEYAVKSLIKAINDLPDWIKDMYIDK